jgi:predicted regulator of Ras-like GTPase activity (Roadblock/LC7/MglB family)
MDIILTKEIMQQVIDIMQGTLIESGVDCAFLVDRSGNLIVSRGDPPNLDVLALATLTAANFGATAEIATIVGEEDFSLLFHKGKNENVHISKIGEDYILLTLFGNKVALGIVRMKTAKVSELLIPILSGN